MKIWAYVLSLWFLWSQANLAACAQEQKWLNVPDAPLEFALLANGYTLSLTNVSSTAIQKHTLGCVDPRSLKMTRKLRTVTVGLEPGKSSFGNLSSYGGDLATCKTLHSALSVIGVTFTDGHTWEHPTNREPKSPSGA
jgi:hypothetical protein